MNIVKIADGAFFVPSYSDQTITRAYDMGTTMQSFGPNDREDDQGAEAGEDSSPELEITVR